MDEFRQKTLWKLRENEGKRKKTSIFFAIILKILNFGASFDM